MNTKRAASNPGQDALKRCKMMQRREDIIRGSEKALKEVEKYNKMANGSDGFDSTVFDFTDDDDVQEESFPRVGTVK